MSEIDSSWYTKPCGIRERVASGGVVARLEKGKIFVALTREGDREDFVLPKGGVEAGETLLAAACREIEEETGLRQLTLIKKLEVLERLNFDKSCWSLVHLYLFHTEQVEATPTDSSHHFAMGWFPIDRLPRFLWPEQRELLERSRDYIFREIQRISSP